VASTDPRHRTPEFPLAACSGRVDADWFPEDGVYREEHLRAFAICYACPEAHACREFGSTQADGIWGGIDFSRRSVRTRYRQQRHLQTLGGRPVDGAP
jgi:hypothetical protein